MIICIQFGGVRHCFEITEILFPIGPHIPGVGPVNYPQLFRDATIVASLKTAASQITEGSVRDAILKGVEGAVGALERRSGGYATISNEK